MPTGYTSPLYDGKDISFEDFVKRCAHAFIVDLRDESADSEIPRTVQEPVWQNKRFAEATLALEFYENMSDEDAEQGAVESFQERHAEWEKMIEHTASLKKRYEDMLAKVKDWEITPDLQGLKDFMIQQLQSSIDFDTDHEWPEPKQVTGPEYKKTQIESAQRMLTYAREDMAKAAERRKQNQEWLDHLWDSLEKTSETA